MTCLLDTHALFWHLFEPAKLSPAARQAIADCEARQAGLIVLSLVLAELYYLLLKFQVESLFPEVLTALKANSHYRIEPILLEDVGHLPVYPEVPEMHDRLIVIASNRLKATLITKDQKIQASPQVTWLW
jgi:PIN domain nuclease of toxin-antitoxin system